MLHHAPGHDHLAVDAYWASRGEWIYVRGDGLTQSRAADVVRQIRDAAGRLARADAELFRAAELHATAYDYACQRLLDGTAIGKLGQGIFPRMPHLAQLAPQMSFSAEIAGRLALAEAMGDRVFQGPGGTMTVWRLRAPTLPPLEPVWRSEELR